MLGFVMAVLWLVVFMTVVRGLALWLNGLIKWLSCWAIRK